jgi:hypothetical protein
MPAKFIFAAAGAILLIAATPRGFVGPQARTWALMALIFGVVSAMAVRQDLN